ncbi:MAG: PPOX class F420-dependent oxidoreductase [Acidimicrobiales bacterium]|nr:PPOX class F420-dependent oxidoreductase [Acidimicrobiales bacterium]
MVPAELSDLLDRPLVAALATERPDGTLQCNPMWFRFDGTEIKMSHTSTRQKIRNWDANTAVSLCITDPANTFRYVEVRGFVTGLASDLDAQFHRELRVRYGMDATNVPDAAERVVVTIRITYIGGREMADQTKT